MNSPFACNFNQQEHISYRDADENIWDAWYDGSGSWNLQKINGPTAGKTTGPAAAKGPFVWVYTGTQQHYTYVDSSGTVWDSYWN